MAPGADGCALGGRGRGSVQTTGAGDSERYSKQVPIEGVRGDFFFFFKCLTFMSQRLAGSITNRINTYQLVGVFYVPNALIGVLGAALAQ